jgi:hypothetical protein
VTRVGIPPRVRFPNDARDAAIGLCQDENRAGGQDGLAGRFASRILGTNAKFTSDLWMVPHSSLWQVVAAFQTGKGAVDKFPNAFKSLAAPPVDKCQCGTNVKQFRGEVTYLGYFPRVRDKVPWRYAGIIPAVW